VDPAPAEQGAWVENIPDLPGIRIKARGNNNGDYRALEAKLVREIPAPNALRACLRKSRAASRAVYARENQRSNGSDGPWFTYASSRLLNRQEMQ
jgi:hypothetical protein